MVTFQDRIEEIVSMSVKFPAQINIVILYCKLWLQDLLITWTLLEEKMTAIYVFKKSNFRTGRFILKVMRTFLFSFIYRSHIFSICFTHKNCPFWGLCSRLFEIICHKSLTGHIRHQWPCHISRNFNKVFSWETTWTSENPKNSWRQNCFEEVRPEVLSSCFSTRRSSFSNIFLFFGILRHVRHYLVNVYGRNQSVQFFNSCLIFFVAKITKDFLIKNTFSKSHWFWKTWPWQSFYFLHQKEQKSKGVAGL